MNRQQSRRTFLQSTAIAVPAVIGLNAHVQAEEKAIEAKDGRIGVALCGLGGFAEQTVAYELPLSENVYFAGAITGDPEKGKRWAKQYGFPEENVFGYNETARLRDCEDIQTVHVITPNSIHAENCIMAAEAGKHVICEKPMATTVDECESIIQACKEADVRLAVDYRLQFEPHHVKAMQLANGEKFGPLVNGNYEFSWAYAKFLKDPVKSKTIKQWLKDPVMTGGGALFDTGVYPVQAACYMAGETPTHVRGFAHTYHKDLFPDGVPETEDFTLIFESGFHAQCRASYCDPYHQCTTLGPNLRMEIFPGLKGGWVFAQSGFGRKSAKRLFVNRKEIVCEDTFQLAVFHDRFADAIRNGEAFVASGEMGLRDIKIMKAVQTSEANNGELVEINA